MPFRFLFGFASVPFFLFITTSLAVPFSDIPANDAELLEAVSFLKDQGIVQGYSDGTFGPERNINRYDFTKIIVSRKISEESIQNCDENMYSFSDVPQGEWFTPYVCAAKENGIVNGFGDGIFRGNNPVTIYEALKMILNAYDVEIPETDVSGTEWYEPYVAVAIEKNLIFNIPVSSEYTITRADMAKLIGRQEEVMNQDYDANPTLLTRLPNLLCILH